MRRTIGAAVAALVIVTVAVVVVIRLRLEPAPEGARTVCDFDSLTPAYKPERLPGLDPGPAADGERVVVLGAWPADAYLHFRRAEFLGSVATQLPGDVLVETGRFQAPDEIDLTRQFERRREPGEPFVQRRTVVLGDRAWQQDRDASLATCTPHPEGVLAPYDMRGTDTPHIVMPPPATGAGSPAAANAESVKIQELYPGVKLRVRPLPFAPADGFRHYEVVHPAADTRRWTIALDAEQRLRRSDVYEMPGDEQTVAVSIDPAPAGATIAEPTGALLTR